MATITHTDGRTRDAERSRESILDAAEKLFSERGYESTSLAEIGAATGLSRGTPGYFFKSKDSLRIAVIERLLDARDAALAEAFGPLAEWASAEPGSQARSLEETLDSAIQLYLDFLYARPAFVLLMQREAVREPLDPESMPALHQSEAITDAFKALRRNAARHGLSAFDVREVVLCLVSLACLPLAQRRTLLPGLGLDADSPRFRSSHRRHIVVVLLHFLRG